MIAPVATLLIGLGVGGLWERVFPSKGRLTLAFDIFCVGAGLALYTYS